MLNIEKIVAKLHQDREYRPVGVAVLYRTPETNHFEFLTVQSTKGRTWGFPQGGIEPGETIIKNLSRELAEELGIVLTKEITLAKLVYWHQRLDAEPTRTDKRGFSRGKAYFFTLAQYDGNSSFKLQPEEILSAEWLSYSRALERFEQGRIEKAALLRESLDRAIKILERQKRSRG